MPFGVSRVAECDVQHPTTIHAVKAKSLDKEHVQKYLDDFLDEYDRILTTTSVSSEGSTGLNAYVGPRTTTISQLKRLQRELRGLPPVILEEDNTSAVVRGSSSTPKNKKIIFDDDGDKKEEKNEERKDTAEEIQPKYTKSSESESESNDSGSVSESESEKISLKDSKKRKADEIEENDEEEKTHKKHEHKKHEHKKHTKHSHKHKHEEEE